VPQDIRILMQENPIRGPLEGMVLENRDFFLGSWNDNERSECHLAKKVEIAILKCICGQTFAGLGPLKQVYAPLVMASIENAKKLWTRQFHKVCRLIPVLFMRQFLRASVCENSALYRLFGRLIRICLRSILASPYT
jgi:hypothetical protein